ncbi:MAG: MFS transporter [Alphaproteobacteria bacterium]|nr:MFS transporter [Alphaproteobacteria bacterium]
MTASESSVAPADEAPVATRFTTAYRARLLVILLLMSAFNIADRQGLAITSPAIKRDLALSDTQLGLLLGLGYAVFFALMALPIARLAEHKSRTKIISVAVAVFGVMLALCGSAQNFWQFFLYRIGVGAGDAGFNPPVASLVGDHYPLHRRASAMGIIWLGAPLGAISGAILGGWFAQNLGWRMWFVALGVPAIALSLVAFLTLRDPPRGMSDPMPANTGAPPSILQVLRFLWSKRSYRQILLGAGLAAISMGSFAAFLPRFLVSTFHTSLSHTGLYLGLMSGTSMATGMILGGLGLDAVGKRERRWYVWGPSIGLVVAGLLFILAIEQGTVAAAIVVLFFAHIALFVYWTPTLAMAQNMVGANMRASSGFIMSLVLSLIGMGLGPTLIGVLSDRFANLTFVGGDFGALCPGGAPLPDANRLLVSACADASARGVRYALIVMAVPLIWASFHYLLSSRTLNKDLDTHYR